MSVEDQYYAGCLEKTKEPKETFEKRLDKKLDDLVTNIQELMIGKLKCGHYSHSDICGDIIDKINEYFGKNYLSTLVARKDDPEYYSNKPKPLLKE